MDAWLHAVHNKIATSRNIAAKMGKMSEVVSDAQVSFVTSEAGEQSVAT